MLVGSGRNDQSCLLCYRNYSHTFDRKLGSSAMAGATVVSVTSAMVEATLVLVTKSTIDATVVSDTMAITSGMTDGGVDRWSIEHPRDFSTSTYTETRRYNIRRISYHRVNLD